MRPGCGAICGKYGHEGIGRKHGLPEFRIRSGGNAS
jgi:hypothetical protein